MFSSAESALFAGSGQADPGAFHLRQAGHEMKKKRPEGVDLDRQADKVYTALLERADNLDQVPEAAPEAIVRSSRDARAPLALSSYILSHRACYSLRF